MNNALQTRVERDGGVILDLENFEKKGLFFYVKSFKDRASADAALGDDGVLSLVNRALGAAQRAKANAKVMDETEEDIKARKDNGNTLIITEDEAAAYQPGERDVTSLSGVTKRINELRKELDKAKKAGETDAVSKLVSDIKYYMAKANDLMSEGL